MTTDSLGKPAVVSNTYTCSRCHGNAWVEEGALLLEGKPLCGNCAMITAYHMDQAEDQDA